MIERYDPTIFLDQDMPRMIFTPSNYGVWDPTPVKVGGEWKPGDWQVEGSLEEHRQKSLTLVLSLESGASIKRAALFAWFTSATQRRYVTLEHQGKTYTTRHLAEEIVQDANTDTALLVARTLFSVPTVREEHYDEAVVARAPFKIHIEYHHDPDAPYEEAPLASDQERALGIVVAGATAMLNEIDYGYIPKQGHIGGG